MSSGSTSTSAATPADTLLKLPQRLQRQQRLDDQIDMFSAFLDRYTQDGSPLPGSNKGRLLLKTLLLAAGLSPSFAQKSSRFREIAEIYEQKVGLTTLAAFAATLPVSVSAALPPVMSMTYQELLELLEQNYANLDEKYGVNNIAVSSVPAYRSALMRFAKLHGKTLMDQVGPELLEDFSAARQKFIRVEYNSHARSASSATSALNKFVAIYALHQRAEHLPTNLALALTQLVQESGRVPSELSTTIGKNQQYVSDLMRGVVKNTSTEPLVLLEKELNVPSGTLTSLVKKTNPRRYRDFCPVSMFPEALQSEDWKAKETRKIVKARLSAYARPFGPPTLS